MLKKYLISVAVFLRVNIRWVVLLTTLFMINATVVALSYRYGIDLGDGSTFYQFARNIAEGEWYYQDFVHFRTPGSYYFYSTFISLFGDTYSSLSLALLVESRVIYPIVFVIAAAILFRKRYFWIIAAVAFTLFLLPEYAQLRTVIAFLAVAVMYRGLQVAIRHRRMVFIGLGGVLVASSFLLGQEAGVISGCLAATLIALNGIKERERLREIVWQYAVFAGGFILFLLPFVAVNIFNNTLGDFIYYTFYYAFLLQPSFMDLPFPAMQYENIVYYLPLVLVLLAIVVFNSVKSSTDRLALAVLVAFVTLRLVTHFGRTDVGHLIFVLPEVILMALLTIYLSFKIKKILVTWQLMALLLITAGVLYLLTIDGPSMLLLIPAILLLVYFYIPIGSQKSFALPPAVFSITAIVMTLWLMVLISPTMKSEAGSIKRLVIGSPLNTLSEVDGSYVDTATYNKLTSAKKLIEDYDVTTLFSYPIQPYFYTYADEHATRFMTFEPQTTINEQQTAINELKKSKPEMIIFDPAQAMELRTSLWMINEYVLKNYDVRETINYDRQLWVMTERTKPVESVPFIFTRHFIRSGAAVGLQSPDKGLVNGLIVYSPGYEVDLHEDSLASLSFKYIVQDNECMKVTINTTDVTTLCGTGEYSFNGSELRNIRFDISSTDEAVVHDMYITR